jgi:alginate O-acetyltransferase complex protein AlgI
MAIGSAHMLGYKLAQNFNMPYLSRNITEYWRRWHISLSTWLRDYLFIPLVSRTSGSNWEINRSLLITMTLGGLWHGASWTFVVWGIYHGSLLIVHRTFQNFAERVPGLPEALHTTGGNIIRWVLTCIAICGGWVLFRAQTLEAAGAMMAAMAIPRGGLDLPLELAPLLWTIVAVAACHAFAASGAWKATAGQLPAPAWGFGYSAALTLALGMSVATGPAKAFIYFQF